MRPTSGGRAIVRYGVEGGATSGGDIGGNDESWSPGTFVVAGATTSISHGQDEKTQSRVSSLESWDKEHCLGETRWCSTQTTSRAIIS